MERGKMKSDFRPSLLLLIKRGIALRLVFGSFVSISG